MTVTPIRTRVRTHRNNTTPESRQLAELERQIAEHTAALARPHGYADDVRAELGKLQAARDELVALTARTALAA